MKFLNATAAKNKSTKFNKPRIVESQLDLCLAIRNNCTQGKTELIVKIKESENLVSLVKILKKNGYKVKRIESLLKVTW